MDDEPTEAAIIERGERLREWFAQECDPIQKVVDGLDIELRKELGEQQPRRGWETFLSLEFKII